MSTSVSDTRFPLLEKIATPAALKALPRDQLDELAAEIRAFLVEQVCATGGHLGPNLGVVELTLALHRVFDSPRDAIVFDTGHQAYVHKLLTGRLQDFRSLRQPGGLSGYPSRSESPHDLVENSHASTALSYADGLAKARAISGEHDRSVVAVIGDGALTGGLAWEGLNNLGGAPERPVIVVLNDNGRSYDPTTGAFAAHLSALKRQGTGTAEHQGQRNVLTDLGLGYLGPVDGHDTRAVEDALRRARALAGPVVVHVVTVKGRGYAPAEADEADCLHAVGVVDPSTGRPAPAEGGSGRSWTSVFADELVSVAAGHPEVVAITASMLRPTGLHLMREKFPDRVFDVGIAEQHAVTSAAGLAMAGLHPVVALYATFLNRAFDQVLMDVALHGLPVTFVLDRAGITGPDGSSHHGMWDLALLGTVPGLRVAVPRGAAQLRELLTEAVTESSGPTALRFPKGAAGDDIEALERHGPVDVLFRSAVRDVLLVATGPLATAAVEAAAHLDHRGIGCTVADPRWALPVPHELVELAARHRLVITVEDGVRSGGLGTAVAQAVTDTGSTVPTRALGLPHRFLPHATRNGLLGAAGLDSRGIVYAVLRARAGLPYHSKHPVEPR
ncbi:MULTISPECIES: 1-deoxy-D-xylulose-5-phosphate synthase [Streptomyces]|uniref:1-deoxy-D-xylulose-5-phosphate synthase n=1 Tax=Streptomyces tsukubensis (strain DSM 42081 / NBRC 108919 / NRRL 18488 / 9993) TaxID=1114943 RepID=I2MXV6_STRT9|nr:MULTISPECIES: 1-deoxy-D-xylulose-5-phosphate synthase [Streptomyces]AZK93962.1 1-deoxy-D-xylulose-5-phosphate synthase [Streptomyces tsukubensis]EIF89603.1 1-deoxy-D-xylulose-5-phosphate synthase [Streptomyces tsukubensis NRRL18488]MYS66086.1 1-deoxy-D-xylulose-5-phosphate synthase [Streptomyces sp. SID5473]QKM69918.1 1-deoxy-D-xylulose-5-phosphate synthase [Streptomyces tsukubensis NRRL18488]TAI46105.1 1-deoxy-D-xylulose-5-phosphate synthase [Streptomyces tsukubensis]